MVSRSFAFALLVFISAASVVLSIDPAPAVASDASALAGGASRERVAAVDEASNAAAPVTLDDLHRRESTWPYQVALTRAWRPDGHAGEFGWGVGTSGVLIRIDATHRLRIDFGRFGVHDVPADATDVLERANRNRTGEHSKLGPNLGAALNRRLLDPSGRALAPYAEDLFVSHEQVFVLAFVDPAAPTFAEIARASIDWAKQRDALVVLVAQGGHPDAHVYKYCFDAGWAGVFLMDRFAEAYAADYLDESMSTPNVQVMSPEGRLLFESTWTAGVSRSVMHAIEEAIGG